MLIFLTFLRTRSAYLLPMPLMAVRANRMFLFPSMLVLSTRRMCWKLAGITRDMVEAVNKNLTFQT